MAWWLSENQQMKNRWIFSCELVMEGEINADAWGGNQAVDGMAE